MSKPVNMPATPSSASPLFLREPELRRGMELLYFGYSHLTRSIDQGLAEEGLGRAHHRALYFIARKPDMTVSELLSLATPIALADGDPTAASRFRQRLPFDRMRSLSPTRSDSGRPGSGHTSNDGLSGVMVEEKASEDERSENESEGPRESTLMERLNVPLYSLSAGFAD